MASRRKENRVNAGRRQERLLIDALDARAEFEVFREEVMPELRRMIYRKASAKELSEFARTRLLARATTIALTSADEKAALQAMNIVMDRGDGKATETKKIEVNKVSDEELDALIRAEMEAAKQ